MNTIGPIGELAFHVSVRIPISALQHWSPEAITALFLGVAEIQKAANAMQEIVAAAEHPEAVGPEER